MKGLGFIPRADFSPVNDNIYGTSRMSPSEMGFRSKKGKSISQPYFSLAPGKSLESGRRYNQSTKRSFLVLETMI